MFGFKKKEAVQAESEKQADLSVKKPFFAGNIVKAVVLFLVSSGFALGTFFVEDFNIGGDEAKISVFEAFDYESENVLPGNAVFRFGEGENELALEEDSESEAYLIDVEKGDFWTNLTISNKKVNLVLGKLVFIPNQASFSVKFDGSDLVLEVYDGDIYVGILEDGLGVSDYQDAYSDLFMNRLLVPRDTQITINIKRIDERMRQLLKSKLVKEFKHVSIPAGTKESSWVTDNLEKDRKFVETIKQSLTSDILKMGVKNGNTLFSDALFWAQENLTFMPERKEEITLGHLFDFLDDAMIYAARGEKEQMKMSLDSFFAYLARMPKNVTENEKFYGLYDGYIEKLSVFEAEDDEYEVLMALLDKKFLDKRDTYTVVNTFWLGVYDGLKVDSASAEQALDRYYNYFDLTLGDIDNREFYLDYITYQNQLFDNLLLRYPVFYKKGYFSIKNAVEQTLLGLYDEGNLKDELRQAIISTKIDFLKRLMRFFFEGELNIQEAKVILSLLVEEINQIMPADSSEVAVTDIFEAELQDVANFWGYLNTAEYNSSKTYGLTHRERYETYLVEKDRIWSFINIQEDILGEDSGSETTAEDIRKEVFEAFTSEMGFSEVRVGDVEVSDQRYVDVAAVVEGYAFKASYDRDTDSVKDIYVYDQLISDRAVKLEDLLSLVKVKFADFVDEELAGEDVSEEGFAQRTARAFVAKKISEAGFAVEAEDVSIVDEAAALYRIDKVSFGGGDVLVTFDFVMSTETAKNVMLTVKGQPIVMEDEYTLEELVSVVAAEGDFSGGVRR